MSSFFHFTLRTSDVPAARAFYAAVLGRDHAEIFQLHEQAVARGAKPHWLGYLAVPEVDRCSSTHRDPGISLRRNIGRQGDDDASAGLVSGVGSEACRVPGGRRYARV